MLLFGHLGISLAAGVAVQAAMNKYGGYKPENKIAQQPPAEGKEKRDGGRKRPALKPVSETLKRFDIRVLVIGSILPDIIDKPLGVFNLGDGRSISHTLFFLIVLTCWGLYLYSSRQREGILVLAAGVFLHLTLDQMWLNTHTLLWPLLGWQFFKGNPADWLSSWKAALTREPAVYIPEYLGLLAIVSFSFYLLKKGKLIYFLKKGHWEERLAAG
jgi:inner membrane protein